MTRAQVDAMVAELRGNHNELADLLAALADENERLTRERDDEHDAFVSADAGAQLMEQQASAAEKERDRAIATGRRLREALREWEQMPEWDAECEAALAETAWLEEEK